MKSISFDRAADYYDETRGFPPGVSDEVAGAALTLLRPGARVLEIGIGTGRISKPLLARGLQVTGADLSRRMMQRLRDTLSPGLKPPDLLQADAARLPLAGQAFDAVLSVHVFHLVADWRAALAEIRRVLEPDGVFLTGYDWRLPATPLAQVWEKWKEILQAHGEWEKLPGPPDFDEIKTALTASGAWLDEREAARWTRDFRIAAYLQALRSRIYSSTWGLSDGALALYTAELRTWAEARYGDLQAGISVTSKFIWQRFRWDR